MKTTFVWILVAVLAGTGALLRFYQQHEDLPKGCDEFGYLNQAKAMTEHRTFEDHTNRPWLSGLLDTLRSAGITEQEIAWMVTPHAYHVIPETNTIINQYPPATAFLLQFIPIEWRRQAFPLLAMLILVISFAAARMNKINFTVQDLLFAGLLLLIFFSPPFITELARVNSLAFTWGLLLAAGMFLEKRILLAAVLIGLSVNFRTANILMLAPLLVLMITKEAKWPPLKNVILPGVISIITISPLLIYNYLLTGNAFTTTYSSIDTAFAGWSQLKSNFLFYFDWDQRWFRVHVIIIPVCILLMILRKATRTEFAGILLFPVLNYLFFLLHAVQMDYYPYASSVILIGWTLGQFGKIPIDDKTQYFSPWLIVLTSAVILMVGYERFSGKPRYTFNEVMRSYSSLCEYDIVWGDMLSGTTEYACDNNGFRYFTTTPRARKTAMKYLKENGYTQLILIDDTPVKADVITEEVINAGLFYKLKEDKFLKRVLIIN